LDRNQTNEDLRPSCEVATWYIQQIVYADGSWCSGRRRLHWISYAIQLNARRCKCSCLSSRPPLRRLFGYVSTRVMMCRYTAPSQQAPKTHFQFLAIVSRVSYRISCSVHRLSTWLQASDFMESSLFPHHQMEPVRSPTGSLLYQLRLFELRFNLVLSFARTWRHHITGRLISLSRTAWDVGARANCCSRDTYRTHRPKSRRDASKTCCCLKENVLKSRYPRWVEDSPPEIPVFLLPSFLSLTN
jgi:hypothetical protein